MTIFRLAVAWAALALPTIACAQLVTGMLLGSAMASSETELPKSRCEHCHVELFPLHVPTGRWGEFSTGRWQRTKSFSLEQGWAYVFERQSGQVRRHYVFDPDGNGDDRYFLPSKADFNPHFVLD